MNIHEICYMNNNYEHKLYNKFIFNIKIFNTINVKK